MNEPQLASTWDVNFYKALGGLQYNSRTEINEF